MARLGASGSWLPGVAALLLGVGCALTSAGAFAQRDLSLGVFYFPGWRDDAPGAPAAKPWQRIKDFPERKPLLGWYDEGNDDVMRLQLEWMIQYGLQFVVFDWYWANDGRVMLDHALAAYFRAPQRTRLPFALLWANHGDVPSSQSNFDQMVDWWVKYYAARSEFLRVDGKPVVFIYSSQDLAARARAFGTTAQQLLSGAQKRARDAGLPGFYFVAGVTGDTPDLLREARAMGYSAVSAYNLHAPAGQQGKLAHSFKELDAAYQTHWRQYAASSSVPTILPLTAGWDKRPWGGTYDSRHDQCMPTLNEFRDHLAAGRKALEAVKQPGTKLGVLCCWNEFGEGSYIEPTQVEGKARLERLLEVFGK
ncbi:glycoside hydrolase family 99-like domain-containing protein [Aquabacterium sp.]|uniref:glycoside hydrolase family 99-like domain-containing protein n=1 Tax=Aquabacterium sp. TaxID=1872578 RepID=UPI002E365B95|nr:glycoside hydrolase family 99-like domain-containing protein [Aquabacterium sp.]HEX5310257.1 glycoside hydrolase family 99-like domain-containing protein [Aquabacterium sp.]